MIQPHKLHLAFLNATSKQWNDRKKKLKLNAYKTKNPLNILNKKSNEEETNTQTRQRESKKSASTSLAIV